MGRRARLKDDLVSQLPPLHYLFSVTAKARSGGRKPPADALLALAVDLVNPPHFLFSFRVFQTAFSRSVIDVQVSNLLKNNGKRLHRHVVSQEIRV